MKVSEKQLRWLQRFYKVFLWTLRYKPVNQEIPDSLLRNNIPFLAAFWHDEVIPIPRSRICYSVPVHAVALTSPSRDGNLVEAMCAAYGIETIRGSSSKGGCEAIREIKKRMKQNMNNMVSIAVDGPRGPARVVKPGIIYLASILQMPIVTMRFLASPVSILYKAWDCQKIPLPFAAVRILYGEPYYIPKRLSEEELEEHRLVVQERLLSLDALRSQK